MKTQVPLRPVVSTRLPLFERIYGSEPSLDAMRILSIDGGGIRGLIPGVLLAELEERTGQPISRLFDHIAGTSTGSVIALGVSLASPDDRTKPRFRAQEVVDRYATLGQSVFSHQGLRAALHKANPTTPKYFNASLHNHLQSSFGGAYLSEALMGVTIPAFAICSREAFVFSSVDANASATHDFKMWEVARASSAAPTVLSRSR